MQNVKINGLKEKLVPRYGSGSRGSRWSLNWNDTDIFQAKSGRYSMTMERRLLCSIQRKTPSGEISTEWVRLPSGSHQIDRLGVDSAPNQTKVLVIKANTLHPFNISTIWREKFKCYGHVPSTNLVSILCILRSMKHHFVNNIAE